MAIPEQHRIPELEEIERAFHKDGLDRLSSIDDDTIATIGRFVVSYSFIELNLRRCIEILWRAEMLPDSIDKRPILRLPTFMLVDAAKTAVESMDHASEPVADTIAKLDEIEYRRSIRNLLAHFAPRYLASEHAIVFFTRSEADAQQALGRALGPDGICYAILRKSDVIGLLHHIIPYEKWIARKAAEWWQRYLGN
jgi:hypothetical protein